MAYLAAVVQLTTTKDANASFDRAEALVDRAAAQGAHFVALPEAVNFMGSERDKLELAEPIDGPNFSRLSRLAKAHSIWLLGGTLPEIGPTPQRAYNTSTLWSPDGALVARYRKIHLFDVELGPGATLNESESVQPGTAATVADTPLGRLGLTICYDLRFPTLYRTLFHAGVEVITVPSAFTVHTGRDHWEVLLRARAIENQCYVVAPGQFGVNGPRRQTYGRSMIVDPWGTVLAVVPDEPGLAFAEIDLERGRQFRERLPCRAHERPEAYRLP